MIGAPAATDSAGLPGLRCAAQAEQDRRGHLVELSGGTARDEANGLWFQPLMERHFPEELAVAGRTGPNGNFSPAFFRHQVLLSTRLWGLAVKPTARPSGFPRHRRSPGFDDVGERRPKRHQFKAIPLPNTHEYIRNLCLNQTIRSPLYRIRMAALRVRSGRRGHGRGGWSETAHCKMGSTLQILGTYGAQPPNQN
jgi:hypothetical protein